MSPPTAIIAEDEKALRDELRQLLRELWPELLVLGEAGTGIEAAYGVGKIFKKHPKAGTKLVQWGVATGFFNSASD